MNTDISQCRDLSRPGAMPPGAAPRTTASYEGQLVQFKVREAGLRLELARYEDVVRQKDDLIEQQELLSRESNHRLLNDLQMVMSLLSLQSRTSANAETAEQLGIAANRVGMVGRVHRRLHCLDGVATVSFKQYLEELCSDFSTMLSSEERTLQVVIADDMEFDLPAATGIALGFIVSELLANATKYGKGPIRVALKPDAANGFALSISNDGPALPDGFDPAACKGLGMKIIQSFVQRIKGELEFGRNGQNQGAVFTVLFS
jgi:two-component sensor histidine kinase